MNTPACSDSTIDATRRPPAHHAPVKRRRFDPEDPSLAARRAEAATGRGRERGRPGAELRHRGDRIAVNSPEHGALVGRATEAKVTTHADVRDALAATGTERLAAGSSALGRYMASGGAR